MILSAFTRALGQLRDPRILKVLALSILLAGGAVVALITLGIWGITALFALWESANGMALPWIGEVGWLKTLGVGGAALGLTVLGAVLVFPLAAAVASFFYEEVVEAVEARHYPRLRPSSSTSFWAGIWEAGRFLLLVIGLNAAAFLLGLLLPPIAPFLYWAVNSYIIGHEMVFVVALRRGSRAEAKSLWRRHLLLFWGTAAVLLIPMHVPLLNFVALVIAVAVFTHLYHSVTKA